MTFMVAMGLSVTAMIRVGNQKGLKRYKELRRIAFSIFMIATLFAVVFAILFFIFSGILPKIYLDLNNPTKIVDNYEVITIASKLLLIAAVFQITDTIQVVALGALRGMQDVKIPTFITFVSYWLIGFPISYYLSLYTDYKSSGIWIGLLAGLSASGILLFIRFNYLSNKLIIQNSLGNNE